MPLNHEEFAQGLRSAQGLSLGDVVRMVGERDARDRKVADAEKRAAAAESREAGLRKETATLRKRMDRSHARRVEAEKAAREAREEADVSRTDRMLEAASARVVARGLVNAGVGVGSLGLILCAATGGHALALVAAMALLFLFLDLGTRHANSAIPGPEDVLEDRAAESEAARAEGSPDAA